MSEYRGYEKLIQEMLLDNGLGPDDGTAEILSKINKQDHIDQWLDGLTEGEMTMLASGEFDSHDLMVNGFPVPDTIDYPAVLDEVWSGMVNHHS